MRRHVLAFVLGCAASAASAQYPYTRMFDPRAGQQRPHFTGLAQDGLGLLWMATDLGLMRTDGARTDLVWPVNNDHIGALLGTDDGVLAFTDKGVLVRCRGYASDTVRVDTTLARHPVRCMLRDVPGRIWIGTYGAGVIVLDQDGRSHRISTANGLPDDHANALAALPGGRIAVATDQGIAICEEGKGVVRVIDQEHGAPDNLVLSLAPGTDGRLWAGTDGRGVFSCLPGAADPAIQRIDTAWAYGPVVSLAVSGNMVWAGSVTRGTIACDVRENATYPPVGMVQGQGQHVMAMLLTRDGAMWWCDGSEHLRRCDPDVLYVPQHEDMDLRHITALCSDGRGWVWFATENGVFHHPTEFSNSFRIVRSPVVSGREHPVVALHASMDSAIWVGTFGEGVYRIDPDGTVDHFTAANGLCNDNVLAIRSGNTSAPASDVWLATLAGICHYRNGHFEAVPTPGSGFLYDIRAMPDGGVIAATDGSGVVRVFPDGTARVLMPGGLRSSTFYSLTLDSARNAWASGPATGLCLVGADSLTTRVGQEPPLDGPIFSIKSYRGRVVVLGKSGFASFDPNTNTLVDLSASTGLVGVEAELNTSTIDRSGTLWLACSEGLVRLELGERAMRGDVPTVITGLDWGDEHLPLDSALTLRHDQNFLTFRFAGLHYAAPEELQFEYRLDGFDPVVRTTRDRQVTWPRLPPGRYRFEVRAILGGRMDVPWTGFSFRVQPPWWLTGWALMTGIALATLLIILLLRARDRRLRFRERTEREKARYQLEALRSQVNPHFLFNSFNTLIELIEEDRGKAVRHVEHLSDFFREMLQVRDKDLIPLIEEMHLVETYFHLEQRRFGDRIRLTCDAPPDQLERLVPPMAVQLLVENALKHNRTSELEPLHVALVARNDMLEVRNPYRPRTDSPRSTGFGIESIKQRYAALTEREVEVRNDGANFVVRIPLIAPPNERRDR